MSPYNAIEEYQRLASAIALNTNAPPNTRVSEDGMKISYHASTIDVSDWRTGLQTLITRVSAALDALCYGQSFGLQIPDKVPDDWTDDIRGHSWVKNAQFVPDSLALLNVMLEDKNLGLATELPDGTLEFKTAAMWRVIQCCNTINDDLALLSFFVNGQTPRVAEFIDHKVANSVRPRTCFYDDHTSALWMVIRRHKTENLTGAESFSPTKCPPVLTNLLVRYLTIVRPVESAIVYELSGQEASTVYDEFMWVRDCQRTTADHFRRIIPQFLEDQCGARINVHDWRQISTEMSRVFLGSEHEMRKEELDALAGQRGHSLGMSRTGYAAETSHLPTMSSDLLLRYARASKMQWSIAGVIEGEVPMIPLATRQRIQAQQIAQMVSSNTDADTSQSVGFDPIAFTITIKGMLDDAMRKNKEDVRKAVQENMAEALATLQLQRNHHPTALHIPANASHDRAAVIDSTVLHTSVVADPFDRSDFDDIYEPLIEPGISSLHVAENNPQSPAFSSLELLKLHFPSSPNPQFKTAYQQQVVEHALARTQNFIAVLPTGGGKSLAFTLPPLNEPNLLTFVIVPNKALVEDHLQRCAGLSLRAIKWSAGTKVVLGDPRVYFLAVETAVSSIFTK